MDGIDRNIVLTYENVLNGNPASFNRAVIIGGGGTGLELALYLSEYGCTVSVVEMLDKIGNGLETMTKKILLGRLKENNVNIMTETKLVRVESTGAVVARSDGNELLIEAERVIFASYNFV